MKKLWMIRHGPTRGNLERRYIGRTDEPLCEAGIAQAAALQRLGFPDFERVFVSPYQRCRQTAELALPNRAYTRVPGLRECDFGIFEGRSADELSESAEYADWLKGGCTFAIPGGEDVAAFKERCTLAFSKIASAATDGAPVAVVTHGGCIMAILERFASPKRAFYEWHVPNCGWVSCDFDGELLTLTGGTFC